MRTTLEALAPEICRVVSAALADVVEKRDRSFGVVTAFVPGEAAGDNEFTSSLPARLFVDLMPELGLTLPRD